jgi:uncharacterized protein (DUF58 family)
MRPTRRAYVVAAVLLGALVSGTLFGARALDAVVLPATIALVAAVVQVWRTPVPDVDRTLPPADVPGTIGTVELSIRGPRSYPVTVRDRLPAGVPEFDDSADTGGEAVESIGPSEAVVDSTIGGEAAYEIRPQRRGEHEIGPVSVALTDVFGLFERTVTVDVRGTLLVYPPVRRLSGAGRAELRSAYESRSSRTASRDAFEGLREYVPGDARRDIHWKTSAKRGDLIVQEFIGERQADRVTVAAGTDTGAAAERDKGDDPSEHRGPDVETVDAMAEAAAAVCRSFVDYGLSIALATPSGQVEASPGSTQSLLEHLATAGGGPVPTVDADVVVRASAGSASVRFAQAERRFEALTAEPTANGMTETGTASPADSETDGTTDSETTDSKTTGPTRADEPAEVA